MSLQRTGNTYTGVTADNLNEVMEFDTVVSVFSNGVVEVLPNIYAPDVTQYIDEHGSAPNEPEICQSEPTIAAPDYWEFLTGYTGQHGYNGACMHQSEYVGGRLAQDILDEPAVYCVVAIYEDCICERDEYDQCIDHDTPSSWAVLKLERMEP